MNICRNISDYAYEMVDLEVNHSQNKMCSFWFEETGEAEAVL